MFFRKALATDFFELREKKWTTTLENCYLIEDHSGIIGFCMMDHHTISKIFVSNDSYKKQFLELIEEFFFMAYPKLYAYDLSLLDYGWNIEDSERVSKIKPTNNPYTLTTK